MSSEMQLAMCLLLALNYVYYSDGWKKNYCSTSLAKLPFDWQNILESWIEIWVALKMGEVFNFNLQKNILNPLTTKLFLQCPPLRLRGFRLSKWVNPPWNQFLKWFSSPPSVTYSYLSNESYMRRWAMLYPHRSASLVYIRSIATHFTPPPPSPLKNVQEC